MKQLSLLDAAGLTVSGFDFTDVGTNQLSAPWTGSLKNTGDEALTGPLCWLEQTEAPGELRVTVGGVAITATSQATAQTLPPLPVGAELSVTAEFYGEGQSDWGELCALPR